MLVVASEADSDLEGWYSAGETQFRWPLIYVSCTSGRNVFCRTKRGSFAVFRPMSVIVALCDGDFMEFGLVSGE